MDMQVILVALIAAIGGGSVTGVFGMIQRATERSRYRADMRKILSEADKTDAEADKITAETDDLSSARLIRELDRISSINEQQGNLISRQRDEIDTLRGQIFEYMAKEAAHAIEVRTLNIRINELERGTGIVVDPREALGAKLRDAHPIVIEHTPNEFDDDSAAKD